MVGPPLLVVITTFTYSRVPRPFARRLNDSCLLNLKIILLMSAKDVKQFNQNQTYFV